MIRRVDVNADTVQSGLEGFFGSRVQHLVTNAGRVGVPSYQDQFGGGSSIDRLKIQVDESVAAIVVRQFAAKVFVCLGLVSLGVNDNRLLVLNLVNVIAQLLALAQLEGIEGSGHFVIDNDTCRL